LPLEFGAGSTFVWGNTTAFAVKTGTSILAADVFAGVAKLIAAYKIEAQQQQDAGPKWGRRPKENKACVHDQHNLE
jgi:hypothetical protein